MTSLADETARERAATVMDRNLVVTAGAGTGKTTLLVDRVTHLLFRQPDPVPIGAIVALTFTNKAASEMKMRLHDRLRLWSRLDPGRAPAASGDRREWEQMAKLLTRYGLGIEPMRDLARSAQRDLEKSQFGTIHSFAAHLLRLYPHEGGVDPEFLEDEGSRLAEHVGREWRLWLDEELGASGADHAAWRAALAAVRLDDLRELAVRLCNELVPLEALRDVLVWEAGGTVAPAAVRAWAATLRDRGQALRARHEKANTLERMLDVAIARLSQWAGDAGFTADQRILPPELDRAVPGKTTTWTKEDHAAAKEVIEAATRLTQATLGPIAPLLERLLSFAGECRRRFVERGVLSFDGLLARARDLLRDHPAVRRALQEQYRAILVDEFQDTDPVQYELALFLAEASDSLASRWDQVRLQPGKLFVVGDPKQSIYAFRRADMEAYDRVIEGVVLGDGAFGESQVLHTNFRSHARVLEPVNACFDRLFPSSAQRGLQPKNEPLLPARATAPSTPHEGVSVRLVRPTEPDADADTATRCEADSLALWLASDVLGRQTILDGDDIVTVQPRHVAMLLRTLTRSRDYLEAFRRHGIPYVTEGEKHFFARQEVIDAGNLLCASLNPHDDIAVAAVLRSPLGGLTDRELEEAVSAGRLDFRRHLPGGLPAHERVVRLLRELHHALPRLPVSEGVDLLFERAPLMELAAASLDGEQAVANLRKLRGLLSQTGDQPGVTWGILLKRLRGWFVDRPDEAESALAEEGDETEDRRGAVRVLSIHKAKGLEFPMVVLAGLHRGKDGREDRIGVQQDWASGVVGLRVGAFSSVGSVYAASKLAERQRAEERRILYVAMTRAKRRLVLSAGLTTSRSARGGSGLSLVGEGWGVDLAQAALGPLVIGESAVPVEIVESDEIPLTRVGHAVEWHPEQPLSDVQLRRWEARERRQADTRMLPRFQTATGLLREASAAPASPGVGLRPDAPDAPIRAGTLAHRLLERWDFSKGADQLEALLQGDLAEEDEAVRGEVKSMLEAFARAPLYHDLQRAEILGREVPFVVPSAPIAPHALRLTPHVSVLEGVIDLLYRLDGQVWIADYKTDRVTPVELEARAERYRPQAEAYKAAVLQALGGPAVNFQFVFLRVGRAVQMS